MVTVTIDSSSTMEDSNRGGYYQPLKQLIDGLARKQKADLRGHHLIAGKLGSDSKQYNPKSWK